MIDEKSIEGMSTPTRSAVAKVTTSREMLDYLLSDPSQEVRARVMMNPWTHWATLWACYKSEEPFTKRYLAKNPNLPPQLLERLAMDEDYIVRAYIAKNDKTPDNILEKLYHDKNEIVRDEAKARYAAKK